MIFQHVPFDFATTLCEDRPVACDFKGSKG